VADYLRLQKSEESVLVDIPFWFLARDGTASLLFSSLKIREVVKGARSVSLNTDLNMIA
jgi:hypothetical protein